MANKFSEWFKKKGFVFWNSEARNAELENHKESARQASAVSQKSAGPSGQPGWFAKGLEWYSVQAADARRLWQETWAAKPKPPKDPEFIGAVLAAEKQEINRSRETRLAGLSDKHKSEAREIEGRFAAKSGGSSDGGDAMTGALRKKTEGGRPLLGPLKEPVENDFVGLCFSGGGIRSATFNLGVTTGLAKQGYLKQIDYLSTVSGGGYIGSWLTAWIKRSSCTEVEDRLKGSLGKVVTEKMMVPTSAGLLEYPRYQEPDPVRFLRRFSNYLAPRTGLLSTDLWALIAVYLRNVMLNLALLIAAGACVLSLPLLGMHWGWRLLGHDLTRPLMWLIRLLLVLAMGAIAYSFASFSGGVQKNSKLAAIVKRPGWWVVAPLLVAAGCMTYVLTPSLMEKLYCVAGYARLGAVDVEATGWFTRHLPAWLSGSSAYRWLSTLPAKSGHPGMVRWVIEGAVWYSIIWVLGTVVAQIVEVCALFRRGAFKNLGSIVNKLWEAGRVFFGKGSGPQPVAGSKTVSLTAALISGALGGLLLYAFGQLLGQMPAALWKSLDKQPGTIPFYGYAALWTVMGPPLLLWTVALVSVLHVGLLGRSFPDAKREWLSRLCAMLALTALAWAVFMGLSLYGAMIFKFLFRSTWAQSTWGRVLKWILAGGWVSATAGGVIGGNMSKATPQKGNGTTGILLKLAPAVFILGLLLLLSFGVDSYLRSTPESGNLTAASAPTAEQYNSMIDNAKGAANVGEFAARFTELIKKVAPPSARSAMDEAAREHWAYAAQYLGQGSNDVLKLLLALAAIVLLLSWRLDVNEFSIHLLYRNRLARCYLGASREARKPQAFTGFDVKDDVPLASLRVKPGNLPGIDEAPDLVKEYAGPYHILCTALNLVSGKELAWQTRKARSFIYSPLYCGYDFFNFEEGAEEGANAGKKKDAENDNAKKTSGKLKDSAYRPTEWYSAEGGPYLGTALAISGAAATPNMGYHSSSALTFLMAVFNVRLGWWGGNTRHESAWKEFGPKQALYLGLELVGRTDDENAFVYLSDGGHFENLGLYELVRRKCRYIIASDGGADSDYSFGDLGNAIQKCRRDLGAEIKIDVSKLRPRKDERVSDAHYAFGRITYHDGSEGSLLYLKSSLTKSDRQDVQSFATDHPAFPHDSTADQFFNEDRFESYRALGEDVLKAVMNDVEKELKERGFTAAIQVSQSGAPQLGPTPNPAPGALTSSSIQEPNGEETKKQAQVTASSGAAAKPAKQELAQPPKTQESTPSSSSRPQAKAEEPVSAPMTVAGLFTALEQIYSTARPAQKASFTLEEVDVARMKFSYETD